MAHHQFAPSRRLCHQTRDAGSACIAIVIGPSEPALLCTVLWATLFRPLQHDQHELVGIALRVQRLSRVLTWVCVPVLVPLFPAIRRLRSISPNETLCLPEIKMHTTEELLFFAPREKRAALRVVTPDRTTQFAPSPPPKWPISCALGYALSFADWSQIPQTAAVFQAWLRICRDPKTKYLLTALLPEGCRPGEAQQIFSNRPYCSYVFVQPATVPFSVLNGHRTTWRLEH
ncbi:hypothetical protein CPAR01_02343 [Colletotrichum paranaense]|uniref:Uncharacterized protein n=1 Tax=Colletotrichum paranaense TaxID=1914294 RepID=A0ABQ9SZ86_9PEZI|nr:uncharacterized protein CPAR01_02343 [Colletotrichum paranaense]KAK1544841.1 hypothetical protein CPAR01_02343 [Colletotrichum paranaense]